MLALSVGTVNVTYSYVTSVHFTLGSNVNGYIANRYAKDVT